MKLSIHPYFLEFIHPFVLAHGSRTGTNLVFVKLEHNGVVGYGEASLPPYRSETIESVSNWVVNQKTQVKQLLSLDLFQNISLFPFSESNPSASAALQSAILNWYSNYNHIQLSDIFKPTNHQPKLTLTITKSDVDFIEDKLNLSRNFHALKIKLTGNSDDLEFVKFIRSKTDIPFCIDINQGYTDKEKAIQLIDKLEAHNCLIIEQPLKFNNHDGHYWLKQRTKLPIIADESIGLECDLKDYYQAYSGVNIKLMKCGGVFQAQQMIQFIDMVQPDYIKLIGCMSESSLGVSMAAILSSHCQMADLDSPYLNKNNPFNGFEITGKKICLAEKIEPKEPTSF